MKQLAEDVEVGKFGGTVSTPPTKSSVESKTEIVPSTTQTKVVPINYDNAILVIKFDDSNFDYSTTVRVNFWSIRTNAICWF